MAYCVLSCRRCRSRGARAGLGLGGVVGRRSVLIGQALPLPPAARTHSLTHFTHSLCRTAMAETAARLSGRGSPAPCAPGFLAPILCVGAVQLALTIGFICYSQSQWLQKNASGISEEFLQCLRLISHFNSSTPNLSEMEMQKLSKSCSQVLQGVKQLVKQVMPPTPNRSGHKGQLSSRTRKISQRMAPYAHLTIKRPTQSSTGIRTSFPGLKGKLITSWEEKVGVAHLREMGYSQGSLQINHHGLYYIYAQILFRYHADHPLSTKEYQLVQYVYRKMAKYPTPTLILRGASTWCSGNHNLYSVYQGGVFNLQNDDKIFVTVSNISLVDIDEASSYLGAFKLD
ncbi:LOW QUALITY PROTEIN: tumor necrosis factor ligand superfamily member 11 [Rhinoraja longicauda]